MLVDSRSENEQAWIDLHNEYVRRRDELLHWFLAERAKLRVAIEQRQAGAT